MTTLYRPVLIESAEQAEALPVGTLAKDGDLSVAVKAEDGHWARTDVADGLPMMDSSSMVGWTALLPVEAHTQDPAPVPGWGEHVRRHRYVTEWIFGPSPDRRGDCA